MFCDPGLVFGVTGGVGSRFIILRARTRFRRFRGRRVPFSFLARPYLFSAVPRASGLFFMFCDPGLVFGDTEGVPSRFHVLRSRTRFRRYRGRPFPFSCFPILDTFSCFALPDSFLALPRVSGPFFMFCAPGLVFGGNGCVGSLFHVLRSDSFSAVSIA
jgi:hypothetical protein